MPQVDFYILPDTSFEQRALFACRLTEKIYKLGHCVYLHSEDREQAQQLDAALWRYQAASFVPHELCDEQAARLQTGQACVQIGWSATVDNDSASAVLINLAQTVPDFFSKFQRISEIVVQTPEVLNITRTAWRHYQQQGCTLERHDLRAPQH